MKTGKRYRTGICDDDALEVKNAILSIALSGDESYDAIHWPTQKADNQSDNSDASHVGLGTVENLGGIDPSLTQQHSVNTHHNISDKK